MNAKDFVINNGSKCQIVKNLSAVPPDIDRTVFTKTFIVKTVDLGDLSTLVISSNQSNSFRIPDFQSQQQQECLDRVVPPIYEVSHKQVIGIRTFSSHLEQLHQIIKLAMDVTTYLR